MEIITEKKTKKTAPRYTIICMSIILSMLLLTGCQNSFDSEDKLIDAIESYNLQGINEVLNDDPELDLNQLPHKPYSTTVYKDENKALSYAIGSEEDILMALLKSGRVDAYSEDEITYIDSAIFLYGLETCEELIKNGAKIDKGSEPTLDHYLRLLSYRNDKNRSEVVAFLKSNGASFDNKTFSKMLLNTEKYLFANEMLKYLDDRSKLSKENEYCVEAIKGDEKTFIKHAFENPDMITNKMLIFAAGSFSPKGLETLTEGGFNFNIEDGNRWNSLHSAAFQNNVEVIDFLLNNGLGAQSKADELYEYTPVDIATMGANREVLHYLLLNGGKMTHDTWKYACQEESGDAIDMLLEEGYEPNKADYFNAFVNSSDNVFEKAMRYGFPCNIDYDGYPIEWVESGGRMLKLIEYGSTVTEYVLSNAVSLRAYKACNRIIRLSNKGKSRALITAVEYGDLKLVNMLIDNGADINKLVEQEGGEYYAPIHAAASSPSEEILTILLKNGADLSLVDSEGNTPYDIAKKAKNKQYMKILKK